MNTLFSVPDFYIEVCKRDYDLTVSKKFVTCADDQLTPLFERLVGFKVDKNIEVGWASAFSGQFHYNKDLVSTFTSVIWIAPNHFNDVTLLWKSKSGRIYDTADEDIDCSDIEFWFEGIDPILFNKQMFPKTGLPFKLKNLTYDLEVTRLIIDTTITLSLREDINDTPGIINRVDDFIAGFNESSEKKDRKDGLVHNWKIRTGDHVIICEADLGSGGFLFMKKLLMFLSKMNCFTKVAIS